VSTVVLIAVCEEEKDEHLLNDEEKKTEQEQVWSTRAHAQKRKKQ
jgi:hypothetical protein